MLMIALSAQGGFYLGGAASLLRTLLRPGFLANREKYREVDSLKTGIPHRFPCCFYDPASSIRDPNRESKVPDQGIIKEFCSAWESAITKR